MCECIVIAFTSTCLVLTIPGYELPWEETPSGRGLLTIEMDTSNGASDYGNKFGEPVITGFTRSFAQRIPNGDILNGDLPNGERREYLKPMLFSGGVGQLDDRHLHKGQPEKDMLVVKVGGPAYRIGLGGRAWTACCVCCRWAASAS